MSMGTYVRRKVACAFLLVSTFAIQSIFAQNFGSIKGQVFDDVTGEALIGANVVIQNTSLGTTTDIDGKFYLHIVPLGTWTIKASYIGYTPITREISITTSGQILEEDFRLVSRAITGETVVVTAQARGQMAAINQQLASNTISNIVASDRIKELPDVSAAESIGRLPGVSIDRYNGEATAVAIRGLAPKYNTITVNGVALPATNNTDRSVDLSLISSNILDGIEVKKANTPDMDADAFGGTVDLRLKEAPEGFQANGGVQGGYNKLQNYYGNYNAYISLSRRMLDSKLGIIAGVNADRNNRTADKLSAAYETQATTVTADQLLVQSLTRRRDETFKSRFGGNILLDYKIPYGKISGNGFYNQAKTDGSYREDQLSWAYGHNSRYYNLDDNISTTSIFTSSVGVEQDFGWIRYDASFASTQSKTDDPDDYRWQFTQEDAAMKARASTTMPLWLVDTLQHPDSSQTGIKSVFIYSTWLIEKQKTAQFNFQIPFKFTNNINGYLKTGGKFKWLNRNFDQEQWGHDNLQYGTAWNNVPGDIIKAIADVYPKDINHPKDFNRVDDSTLLAQTNKWNLYRFYNGYNVPSNFLGGEYHGWGESPDLELMHKVTNVMRTLGSNDWQRQSIGSMGYDYDGIEQYQAAYIMTEINIGPHIMFMPGVRYDADYTKYHGQTFRELAPAGSQQPPEDLARNENIRRNSFWLPMVHLKIQPIEWLRIHLAGTETVTRPDYNMYAPITSIDQFSQNITAANGSLRDSRAKNLDASISIYEGHAGLVTVSGFYKSIDDLILYEGIPRVDTTIYKLLNANLNIPLQWLKKEYSARVNTWVNNPTPAQYRGIEFEWQTNFWYLPSFLKGLVFNINWTIINSTVNVKQYSGQSVTIYVSPHVYRDSSYVDSTSRTQRMPDQPAHILNMTIGYDYKGFSIRASYIYQSDKVTGVGETPLTDAFTAAYERWDLAIQQKIGRYIQLYANLNNLNNRHDESLLGYRQINPTALEYYGTTIDVGIRYNF